MAAHPDRVRIRETETETPTDLFRVFHNHIQLAPDILAGSLNQREYFVAEKFVVIHRIWKLKRLNQTSKF